MNLTPHGPGFSFIDSIELIEVNQKLRAKKWLNPKLSFFKDHFPEKPLMPGVLLIESAAQAAGALWGSLQKNNQPVAYKLAQVIDFRLIQPVFPNQILEIEIELEKEFGNLAQFKAQIFVENKEIARGKLTLSANI